MAYETKLILSLLARQVGSAETVEDAYNAIADAANVEGVILPSYEAFKKKKEAAKTKRENKS